MLARSSDFPAPSLIWAMVCIVGESMPARCHDLGDGLHRWGINAGWQVRIDFPGRGHISLWREAGVNGSGASAVLFVDSVTRILQEKLADGESLKVRSGTHD